MVLLTLLLNYLHSNYLSKFLDAFIIIINPNLYKEILLDISMDCPYMHYSHNHKFIYHLAHSQYHFIQETKSFHYLFIILKIQDYYQYHFIIAPRINLLTKIWLIFSNIFKLCFNQKRQFHLHSVIIIEVVQIKFIQYYS